jgi:hypothetical protein
MHRMVAIVFDHETEAEAGRNKLLELDKEGSIGTYGYAVLAKKADGTVVLKEVDRHGTLSPFANSLLASLCDSASPESAATQSADSAADPNRAQTGEDFIRDMMQVLLPNRVAIVAEVEEEWPPVLDRPMDSIGGAIFRWEVSQVRHAVDTQKGDL